jgi:DNA-binding NarL/FixJ family response regulator
MTSPVYRRTAVLVDRHPLWVEAVERVLVRVQTQVVGSATTPERGLVLVGERKPDLLVTGIRMPEGEMDGITLVRKARERLPRVKAIVLSDYEDREHIDAALAAGAVAYVLKKAHPEDLASAIRQAFDSSVYLADGRTTVAPPLQVLEESPGLTRREFEILKLVAEGHSNAELARKLWVTEQTVKFHLSNIYRKLDVANRTEASRWAQVRGLLPAPEMRVSPA